MSDPKTKVPKCMSTQHPDNVNPPFFAEQPELGGEDEIQEAFYAFSHLRCDEQMWDCEGKEVDDFVVKKLLAKHGPFLEENRLGEDIFLTLRVPNPTVEKEEAKILLESLESIPRSFDTARLFYDDSTPPIFEVILPMASSAIGLDRIYKYYRDFVVGKQTRSLIKGDIAISEWIGEFYPETINVIPLFEDVDHMLNADQITKEYLEDKDVEYQRVFLARSDPALNYGLVTAVLLNWISLQRLHHLEEEIDVDILPIIGIGSAPFRGNFRPSTVERLMEEYSFVHTFTVQSAFKYDNPHYEVKEAIEKIRDNERSPMREIDEERCLDIIDRYSKEYRNQVTSLASMVNDLVKFIPRRRRRKLHIGLFGYSRDMEGFSLPRAIGFTASLYSVGIPPEVLGLNALEEDDLQFLMEMWPHFEKDLGDALRYLNQDSLNILPDELNRAIRQLPFNYETDIEHERLTASIMKDYRRKNTDNTKDNILQAANIRKFLG